MSLFRKSGRGAPAAPEGVRWIDQDGQGHPCTVTYDGFRGGQHHWLAMSTDMIPDARAVANVEIDTMPPNTTVNIDIPLNYTLPMQPHRD